MSKPLNEFGGWLAFLNINLWVSFIVSALGALVALLSLFVLHGLDAIRCIIFFILCGVLIFLSFKMIKLIRIQESMTPNIAVRFINWVSLLGVLVVIYNFWSGYVLASDKDMIKLIPELAGGFIKMVIWYSIWTLYFKHSKRVLAYYGKNADKSF